MTGRVERCPVVDKDVVGQWAAGSVRGQEQSGRSGGDEACLENVRCEREKRVYKGRRQATPSRVSRTKAESGGSGRGRGATSGLPVTVLTVAELRAGRGNSRAGIPGCSERRRDPGRKWGVRPQVGTSKAQEEEDFRTDTQAPAQATGDRR